MMLWLSEASEASEARIQFHHFVAGLDNVKTQDPDLCSHASNRCHGICGARSKGNSSKGLKAALLMTIICYTFHRFEIKWRKIKGVSKVVTIPTNFKWRVQMILVGMYLWKDPIFATVHGCSRQFTWSFDHSLTSPWSLDFSGLLWHAPRSYLQGSSSTCKISAAGASEPGEMWWYGFVWK